MTVSDVVGIPIGQHVGQNNGAAAAVAAASVVVYPRPFEADQTSFSPNKSLPPTS